MNKCYGVPRVFAVNQLKMRSYKTKNRFAKTRKVSSFFFSLCAESHSIIKVTSFLKGYLLYV